MNISFGLLHSPEIQSIKDKQRKKELLVANALQAIEAFAAELPSPAVN
jgi:folate-dependent tRNA-U54 methylase TrmFO/GidA